MVFGEHQIDRKSRTRIELLRAMTETAATLGYAESSVQEVIIEAGVARSTFYAHFRDRDACFLATLDYLADAAAGPGGKARTADVVRSLIDFAERDPPGAKLLFVESLAGGENAIRRRERLRGQLEAAVAEPETFGAVPAAVSRAVIGGVLRLLAMRLRRGDPDLHGLGEDLVTWIGTYGEGVSPTRPARSSGAIEPTAVSPLETPPAHRGGRRLSPGELARSQRLRILRAAAACSYEHGYDAVRVAEITAAAQISRKVFYQQFQSKAEAATEANEALFQATLSACAGAFFGAGSWPDRVWAGGTALLSFLTAHPREAHLGFVETHAISPEAARHVYDRLEAFTLFLEEGFRQRPEAEALPRSISEALAAVMFELAFQNLREHGNLEQLLQSLPRLSYTILAPFMGAEAAAAFIATKTG